MSQIRILAAALALTLGAAAAPASAQQAERPPQAVTVLEVTAGPVPLTDTLPGRTVA